MDSYEVWGACFKFYEVVLLMLRFPMEEGGATRESMCVVTPIAFEAYHEAFMELCREHPECWPRTAAGRSTSQG